MRDPSGRGRTGTLLREALVSLGCMLVLVCLLFPDVLFMERTTTTSAWSPGVLGAPPHVGYPEDAVYERNPYLSDPRASANASETAAEFMAGLGDDPGRALWDPYRSLGSPVLATGDPQLTSPIRWPVALAPTPLAWDVFALLRLVATGVAAHLLAWRLGAGRWGAAAASVVVAAGGFTALHHNSVHVDQLLALCLAMHAVLSYTRKRTAASVLASGVTAAMVIVADNLQAGVVGVLLLTGFALHLLRRDGVPWPRAVARSLVPGALAVGLSAVVLGPMVELAGSPFTDGESIHLHMGDRGLEALPLTGLLDLLAPYSIRGNATGFTLGVGLVVGYLAVLGALRPGPHRRFLVAGAGLLLLKLFGIPLVNDLGRLPVLAGINFQLYTAAPAQLLVGLLVAAGVDGATETGRDRRVSVAVAAALAVIPLALVLPRATAVSSFGIVAVHLGLLAMATWILAVRSPTDAWRPMALTGVVTAQVLVIWLPQMGAVVPDRPVERVLGLEVIDRVVRTDPFMAPAFVDELDERMRPGDRFVAQGGLLYPNTAGVFGLEDLRGMSAFTTTRFQALHVTFLDHDPYFRFEGRGWADLIDEDAHPRLPEVLDLLGVEWLVSHIPLPDETLATRYPEVSLAHEGPRARIYHNPDALDRAFLVDDALAVDSLDAAVAVMEDPAVDLRRTAVVEAEDLPPLPQSDDPGHVRMLESSAARLRFAVSAPATRLLVVSATYYPGWRAWVDGAPVEVLPADGALRAVVVPAGTSEVTMAFRPTSVLLGAAVSLATLFGLLGAVAAARIRRRQPAGPTPGRAVRSEDQVPA